MHQLETLYRQRQQNRGLIVVRRDINQLQRRPSFPKNELAKVNHDHPFVATDGGVFCFDHLVDPNWTGVEGLIRPTSTGSTYRIYSTIQRALNGANAANTSQTIFICAGQYFEGVKSGTGFGTGHNISFYGAGKERTLWQATGINVDAFLIEDGNQLWYFKDITFVGDAVTGYGLTGSVSNIHVEAEDCDFEGAFGLGGDLTLSHFRRCSITAGLNFTTFSPREVYFSDCVFLRHIDFGSSNLAQRIFFTHCEITIPEGVKGQLTYGIFDGCFIDGTVLNIDEHTWKWVTITGCVMDTSRIVFGGLSSHNAIVGNVWRALVGLNNQIEFANDTGGRKLFQISGNHFWYPSDAGQVISILAAPDGSRSGGFAIIGNSFFFFEDALGATYIRSVHTNLSGCAIVGNTFGYHTGLPSGDQGKFMEDFGDFSVVGTFNDSIFGPNAPGQKAKYNITGLNNEFYPSSSAAGPSQPIGGIAGITRIQAHSLAIR